MGKFLTEYWPLLAVAGTDGLVWLQMVERPARVRHAARPQGAGRRAVVVFCASGSRSGMAKMMLKAKGFHKVHNAGTWGNVC